MATQKPPSTVTPTVVAWGADFEAHEINVRFIRDVELMHSCTMTNTYVLDPSLVRGDDYSDLERFDLLCDLQLMNGEALPFGQVVFLSYYAGGEFILESATDRWLPLKVVLAFEDFGYTDVKVLGNFVSVSEKDQFKLKLKFGY